MQLPKQKSLSPPGRPPRFEDVPFAEVLLDSGETYSLKMDVYQDLNQKTPGPCIIYYFGGGWMYGEYKQVTQKAVYFRELIRLVEQGFTIVSPSYRLVSQALFPACIYDSKAVVRFLKAHAIEYNVDPERIGVLGNSAGGHLAAMVAMSSGYRAMEGDVGGNLQYSSAVKAAVVFYAPSDLSSLILDSTDIKEKNLNGTEVDATANPQDNAWMLRAFGFRESERALEEFGRLTKNGDTKDPDWKYVELIKRCSPITYASPDCPPMMILHGGQDPLIPIGQSENLYRALVAADADALYLAYSRAGHGPTMGTEADQMAYQFLKNRL